MAISQLFRFPQFPLGSDLEQEIKKLDLCRIVVGILVFIRVSISTYSSYYYFPASASIFGLPIPFEMIYGLIVMAVAIIFAVGFCTPLSTLALLFLHQAMDRVMATPNLGSQTLYLILFCFLFTNNGLRYSLDRWIQNRYPHSWFSVFLKKSYGVIGQPSQSGFSFIIFCLFAAYAILHFRALLFHVDDPSWIEGKTSWILMTHAYFCKRYAFFRSLEAFSPQFLPLMSIVTGFFQSIWQAFMIPMIFNRFLRFFVNVWGWFFILFSLWALNISFLPYYEVILWTILFIPGKYFSKFSRLFPTGNDAHNSYGEMDKKWIFTGVKWVVSLSLIQALSFPQINANFNLRWLSFSSGTLLATTGLVPPNVFNYWDLKTSEQWPVIYRKVNGDGLELVPFNGLDGQRLSYHRSDVLYFGNSLQWRRNMIGEDLVEENSSGTRWYDKLICVIWYDYHKNNFKKPVSYIFKIFKNKSSDSGIKDLKERYTPYLVHSFEVELK